MTTSTIVLTLIVVWAVLGMVYYIRSLGMVKKAWVNEKYRRVIIFVVLCGPLVILQNLAFEIQTIFNIVRSYILQELPEEREEE